MAKHLREEACWECLVEVALTLTFAAATGYRARDVFVCSGLQSALNSRSFRLARFLFSTTTIRSIYVLTVRTPSRPPLSLPTQLPLGSPSFPPFRPPTRAHALLHTCPFTTTTYSACLPICSSVRTPDCLLPLTSSLYLRLAHRLHARSQALPRSRTGVMKTRAPPPPDNYCLW